MIIKPKKLSKGDTIAVVAPASNAWENEDVRIALEIVESLGFKVKQGKYLFHRDGYLAGSDKNRAEDINRMFADPHVNGIMTLRGGYGTPRMLPYLDYQIIRDNPKVIIGYSDITALINAIFARSGMVTFHGPIAYQTFSEYTLAEFKKVLTEATAPVILGQAPPFENGEGIVDRQNRLIRIVPGKAQGRLVGGNLSLVVKLIGTPYEPPFKGNILFLEDINEEPYRIDGMLTHLWLTGKLSQLAGVVLGKFTDCGPKGPNSLTLERVFEERFGEVGIPTLRGLMTGHVRDQTTLPIGARVELDVAAGTLTLLETAVS